jgi:transposase-like protein
VNIDEPKADLRYLSFKVSYRDLVAMMGERGIDA